MTYEWRKPADDRFAHLFEVGGTTSVCGDVVLEGPAVEPWDENSRGARGVSGLLCPACRREMRGA